MKSRPPHYLKILSQGSFWLAIELIVTAILFLKGGYFTLRVHPDSSTYTNVVDAPSNWLRQARTLGYPFVLGLVKPVSPDYALIPWIHFAWFCVAILLLHHGLRRWGAPEWQVVIADTALLWAGYLMRDLNQSLLTDWPGWCMSLMVAALLLYVAVDSRNWRAWVGLILATAFAYQVRPAYLFLVGLVPAVGWLVRRIRAIEEGTTRPGWRFAGALTCAALIPFLTFCGIRWTLRGHFNLVDFGGFNLMGVAGELLDRPTIEGLPERLRPAALAILEKRESLPTPRAYAEGVHRNRFPDYVASYNANIWGAADQVLSPLCDHDMSRINATMSEIARSVLWLRKEDYGRIVAINLSSALQLPAHGYTGKAVLPPWGRDVFRALLVVALGALAVRQALWRWRPALRREPAWIRDRGALAVLTLIALTWFGAKALLVSSIEIPLERYIYPTFTLCAAAILVTALRELSRIPLALADLGAWAVRCGRGWIMGVVREGLAPLENRMQNVQVKLTSLTKPHRMDRNTGGETRREESRAA